MATNHSLSTSVKKVGDSAPLPPVTPMDVITHRCRISFNKRFKNQEITLIGIIRERPYLIYGRKALLRGSGT